MTNIPTVRELFLFIATLAFIPFLISFTVSYVRYRRLTAGLLGAIIGTVIYFLTMGFLQYALWIRGLILGFIGGIVGAAILSLFYKPHSIKDITRFFDKKNTTLIAVAVILLLLLSLYYSNARKNLEFEVSDPLGDVSQSGYTEPRLSGHDDIDILKVRSRVAGDDVVLEMELAGEISENESVNYQFFVYTERHGFWTHNIDYRYPSLGGKMEKEGRILRARIPVDSLKNRKIFGVIAIASDNEKGLYDNLFNTGIIEQIREILTAPP